jgi:hypothetical protein
MVHRTVRCILVPRLCGPTLARRVDGTPNNPINYSRGVPSESREQHVRRLNSLGTGHCPVQPRLAQVWLNLAKHNFYKLVQLEKFLALR